MIELAASILSVDFARLGAKAQAAVEGRATVLHLDLVDAHFPNLTIGPPVVASLRKVSRVPLDYHLMIEHPDEFIPVLTGGRPAGSSPWLREQRCGSVRFRRQALEERTTSERGGTQRGAQFKLSS